MTTFSATTRSAAVVAADRAAVWAVLTDPVLLCKLTPLVQKIDADGDVWRWHLMRISALGVGISPKFTERMRFDEQRRIEYTHEPPKGRSEHSGADGWYELSDVDGGTRLEISLTLCVDVPLPKLAAPAVQRIMKATMERTGERFSRNLLKHLGVTGTPFSAATR
ncbi:MAG: SRPBCC family protein [Actinomycetota bacterium]|nr:SRPBCC family protein [Actinomycetota bacterium]